MGICEGKTQNQTQNMPNMQNSQNKPNNNLDMGTNNFIIAEFDITDDDINRDIGIINSYEEYMKSDSLIEKDKTKMNEEQIKQCEIRINDKLIPFDYFYKFDKKGIYTIKYSFNNLLTDTNHMFYQCLSLTSIDLSNFNTKNVTNMFAMFSLCSSLMKINLSNCNTQNVTNMSWMFNGCQSLRDLNLSNFNTQNVLDMGFMFSGCLSLTNLNLSNFNSQNVTFMLCMFSGCSSLINTNLITNDKKIINQFLQDKKIFN